MKDYNSGAARRKRGPGQGMGKEPRAYMPSQTDRGPQTSMCSPTRKVSEYVPFELLCRLHSVVMLD